MLKTFSATEARIHLGEVLRIARTEPVIIERDGKTEVVVISKETYDQLVAANSNPRELLNLAHRLVKENQSYYKSQGILRELPPPEDILIDLRRDQDAG